MKPENILAAIGMKPTKKNVARLMGALFDFGIYSGEVASWEDEGRFGCRQIEVVAPNFGPGAPPTDATCALVNVTLAYFETAGTDKIGCNGPHYRFVCAVVAELGGDPSRFSPAKVRDIPYKFCDLGGRSISPNTYRKRADQTLGQFVRFVPWDKLFNLSQLYS